MTSVYKPIGLSLQDDKVPKLKYILFPSSFADIFIHIFSRTSTLPGYFLLPSLAIALHESKNGWPHPLRPQGSEEEEDHHEALRLPVLLQPPAGRCRCHGALAPGFLLLHDASASQGFFQMAWRRPEHLHEATSAPQGSNKAA